ncbi:MAG: hypothetical protein ACR2LN_02910 [Candidatus Levyibacteriota bacterium]
MEQRNQQQGGQGNGFLLGVIVGVLITLLFTTKRGRAILKDVMEHGFEKFSNLEKLMQEIQEKELIEEEDHETGSDYVQSQPVPEAIVSEPAKEETKVKKPAPVPPSTPVAHKEIKTKETEAISPHVVQSVPIVEEKKEVPKLKEAKEQVKVEEPPKSSHGKRWFRGLRKRS